MYWLLILSGFLFAGPLQVTEPVVSQFEDGPALPIGQKLVPGETIFFRFEAANFRTSESGKVQLTGRAQVFDPRGTPVAPPDEVAIATSLREEDKDWKPRFRSQFQLPAIAPPGTYRIRFDALDMQTRQKASGESSFEVEGADVPPSQQLAIRKIAFYRGQDDEAPLKIAAYRPGEAVWVRFDITGFKYAPQNAIDVTYDVAVSNAAGKQLFAQENAAVERSQAFYPQPWVPGIFSLSLQPNTAPGMYAITVTARDAVGKQTVAEKAEFRVE